MKSLPFLHNASAWCLQLLAAGILLQTLYFKFTGAEESVYIFSAVGAEPWGRIASGVAEFIAAILLLIPSTAPIGAILTLGLMAGAIVSHLTVLGIVVKDDSGLLFGLALTTFVSAALVLAIRRGQLPPVGRYLGFAS